LIGLLGLRVVRDLALGRQVADEAAVSAIPTTTATPQAARVRHGWRALQFVRRRTA
jgi:hypothetical protein